MAPGSHDRDGDAPAGVEGASPRTRAGRDRLDELLRDMAGRGATDLHLKPMRPPLLRLDGELVPTSGAALSPDELEDLLGTVIPAAQQERLAQRRRAEFGYSVAGLSRFRATVYHQRGTLAAAFRSLPYELPTFDELALPSELLDVCDLSSGLVVVSAPPGNGRSTTLAALVREIVDGRLVHVMTVESPIELPLRDGMGSVAQQEVGTDTPSYREGIETALAEDCDVVVVDGDPGADLHHLLCTAARYDRLVVLSFTAGTLVDALATLGSPGRTRAELAETLRAAIGLRLVGRRRADGVVPAVELLGRTPRVVELVAEGRFEELADAMREDPGMRTMEQALAALVTDGVVDEERAVGAAPRPEELRALLAESARAAAARQAPQATIEGLEHTLRELRSRLASAGEERDRRVAELESETEALRSRLASAAEERDRRVAELNSELVERRRTAAELARRIEQVGVEKEQILAAVEKESRRFEHEERSLRKRLRELERQVASRRDSEAARVERIEMLERERRRTVEMVEAHCRAYEQRIAQLQEKLRRHGIDPL